MENKTFYVVGTDPKFNGITVQRGKIYNSITQIPDWLGTGTTRLWRGYVSFTKTILSTIIYMFDDKNS